TEGRCGRRAVRLVTGPWNWVGSLMGLGARADRCPCRGHERGVYQRPENSVKRFGPPIRVALLGFGALLFGLGDQGFGFAVAIGRLLVGEEGIELRLVAVAARDRGRESKPCGLVGR